MCECGSPGIFLVEEKVIKTFPRYPRLIGEKKCDKCGKTLSLTMSLKINK